MYAVLGRGLHINSRATSAPEPGPSAETPATGGGVTIVTTVTTASNEGPHEGCNHGEGPYKGLLPVESTY